MISFKLPIPKAIQVLKKKALKHALSQQFFAQDIQRQKIPTKQYHQSETQQGKKDSSLERVEETHISPSVGKKSEGTVKQQSNQARLRVNNREIRNSRVDQMSFVLKKKLSDQSERASMKLNQLLKGLSARKQEKQKILHKNSKVLSDLSFE